MTQLVSDRAWRQAVIATFLFFVFCILAHSRMPGTGKKEGGREGGRMGGRKGKVEARKSCKLCSCINQVKQNKYDLIKY